MRRLSLLVALAAASIAVSACDGGEAPPGPPAVAVRLSLTGAEAARVAAMAASLTAVTGVVARVERQPAEEAEPPYVAVEERQPPGGNVLAATVRYWGAFADFWSAAGDVPSEALRRAAAGEVADWAELGAPAAPLTVYLAQELRPGLERLLGPLQPDNSTVIHWVPLADVVARTAGTPGALTVMPVDFADPRLRSLAVDGVDTLQGMGGHRLSPLVERLWVAWEGDAAEPLARALAGALSTGAPTPIRLVATGDIIPSRCVYARQRAYGDFRRAFLATADFLRAADLTVGSLDASLSDAGEPFGCTPTFSLLAPARSVEGLAYAGFDVVTVATNHIKDCGMSFCGDTAFLETLANLRAAGIQPVGGGENLAESRRPAVLTVRGVRFAFLGYDEVATSAYGAGEASPGTAPLQYGILAEDVTAALRGADVVVVLNQWGTEYTTMPTQRQLDLAREATEAGAALVVGNHPHWVQAVEWRGGAFVAYALGNFVFDQDWSLETQQGAVLEATFLGPRLAGVRLLPVHVYDQHQPRWAAAEEARSILERVREASAAVAAAR